MQCFASSLRIPASSLLTAPRGGMTGRLYKGPACCHLTQDNDAVLAANTFRGISKKDQIHEYKNW